MNMNTTMQANNLQLEQSCIREQRALLVLSLGLGVMIEDKLKNLFQLDRQGERSYTLVHPYTEERIDILLVNYDNPSAVQKQHAILTGNSPNAQVVAVSQGPLPDAPINHIRGMLTASRLFSVLDKIHVPVPASIPTQAPAIAPRTLELVQVAAKPQVLPNPVATQKFVTSPAATCANRYRALVVDDSIAIQKSIELKLTALEQIAGIDFADSGESALEKASTHQYDLIFLDVMMPGIDGYETCTRLRKRPEYKKTPIIMVSGKTSPLDEVKGVMAGCTTYLTKPVQDEAFQKLSLRVLAWLADRKLS
ncbi:MAG: response regulator [Methylococcaceae bacterium]